MMSTESPIFSRVRRKLWHLYGFPSVIDEKISKRFIARLLGPSPVVVDCGAHTGEDTIEMSALWPSGIIHAFEPVNRLFGELKSAARERKNVRCYNLAIADQTGSSAMFVSSGGSSASSSLLEPEDHLISHPDVSFSEREVVEVTTFAAWARAEAVTRVDLFWLDMQGGELPALKASEDLVRSATVIHTEVSMRQTYRGAALYPEVRAWLVERGFVVVREAVPAGWDMGNVLFCRRDSLPGHHGGR